MVYSSTNSSTNSSSRSITTTTTTTTKNLIVARTYVWVAALSLAFFILGMCVWLQVFAISRNVHFSPRKLSGIRVHETCTLSPRHLGYFAINSIYSYKNPTNAVIWRKKLSQIDGRTMENNVEIFLSTKKSDGAKKHRKKNTKITKGLFLLT